MQRTDSLEKTRMLGKIEGMRRRGRQRMRWLDGIMDLMDMNLSELCGTVRQRSLARYSPWGHNLTTEHLWMSTSEVTDVSQLLTFTELLPCRSPGLKMLYWDMSIYPPNSIRWTLCGVPFHRQGNSTQSGIISSALGWLRYVDIYQQEALSDSAWGNYKSFSTISYTPRSFSKWSKKLYSNLAESICCRRQAGQWSICLLKYPLPPFISSGGRHKEMLIKGSLEP